MRGKSSSTGAWLLLPPLGVAALSGAVPPPLVLPALALLCLTCGFGLAAFTWLRRRATGMAADGDYDLAGGLVFIGFAASIMADGTEALRSLAEMQASFRTLDASG